MNSNLTLSFSMISGIMSCLLFVLGMSIEKNKKKSRVVLIWACVFLLGSFTGLEWSFWLEGYNMFRLLFQPIIPLVAYFVIWIAFVIWLFESRKERNIWVVLIIILVVIVLLAINCMNCLDEIINNLNTQIKT